MHVASLVALPPLVAIALSYWGFLLTDGEMRCFDSLDLDTPGLACAPGLSLLFDSAFIPSFHVLLALPVSWLVSKRFHPSTRALSYLCLALAGVWVTPIALFLLLRVFPPGGEGALFLVPLALCPALAMLGLALLKRGGSGEPQAA